MKTERLLEQAQHDLELAERQHASALDRVAQCRTKLERCEHKAKDATTAKAVAPWRAAREVLEAAALSAAGTLERRDAADAAVQKALRAHDAALLARALLTADRAATVDALAASAKALGRLEPYELVAAPVSSQPAFGGPFVHAFDAPKRLHLADARPDPLAFVDDEEHRVAIRQYVQNESNRGQLLRGIRDAVQVQNKAVQDVGSLTVKLGVPMRRDLSALSLRHMQALAALESLPRDIDSGMLRNWMGAWIMYFGIGDVITMSRVFQDGLDAVAWARELVRVGDAGLALAALQEAARTPEERRVEALLAERRAAVQAEQQRKLGSLGCIG